MASCYAQRRFSGGRFVQFFLVASLFVVTGNFRPGCLTAVAGQVEHQEKRTFHFAETGVSFSNRFPGARLSDCIRIADSEYVAVIRPENVPINDSPWYAFQIQSDPPRPIMVRVVYEGGTHRYEPKISRDGVHWDALDANQYTGHPLGREAVLHLETGPEPIWISAQRLLGCQEVETWIDRQQQKPFAAKSILGYSVAGRPIYKLEITEAADPGFVFIIARQHPPEVTGALGVMNFVETLAGDSQLAQRFRRQFCTVVVPLVNPDGVEEGHWRHNNNGVDLNRDWGRFQQPETRALRDELLKYRSASPGRAFLFLDFHSTQQDIFYTQPARQLTFPPKFTNRWLASIEQRFPDYDVRRVGSHNVSRNSSKAWVHQALGIPAITYEFADDASRQHICRIAQGAAEEMMRLLIAAKSNSAKEFAAAVSN